MLKTKTVSKKSWSLTACLKAREKKKTVQNNQSSVTFQLNTLATVCHGARRLFLFLSVWAGLLIGLVQVKPGKVSYE